MKSKLRSDRAWLGYIALLWVLVILNGGHGL